MRYLLALLLLPTSIAFADCIPQRNFSYVDPQGTAHITRVVPVPAMVRPEVRHS